jgi:hypothetical protein
VGVEPTTLAAKDRINGFEGREGHRTPFASARDYSKPARQASLSGYCAHDGDDSCVTCSESNPI